MTKFVCTRVLLSLSAFTALASAHGVARASSSTVPGSITAYWDGSKEHVIYADQDAALKSLDYSSSWSTTSLDAQGNYEPGSPLLSYVDNNGTGRLFFIGLESNSSTLQHDLYEQTGNPPTSALKDLTSGYAPYAGLCGGVGCFLDSSGRTLSGSILAT